MQKKGDYISIRVHIRIDLNCTIDLNLLFYMRLPSCTFRCYNTLGKMKTKSEEEGGQARAFIVNNKTEAYIYRFIHPFNPPCSQSPSVSNMQWDLSSPYKYSKVWNTQ